MRRLLCIFVLLAFSLSQAGAGYIINPYVFGGGAPPTNVTFKGSAAASSGSPTSENITTTADFGAEAGDRYIFVAYKIGNSGTTIIAPSSTIGGVTASKFGEITSGSATTVGFLFALVPTGTTNQTIFLTYSGATASRQIGWWRVTGLSSTTATSSTTDTVATSNALDGTITIDTDGFGLGVAGHDTAADRTWTWTNMNQPPDYDITGTNRDSSGTSYTTAGTALRTATANGTIANPALSLAAWR